MKTSTALLIAMLAGSASGADTKLPAVIPLPQRMEMRPGNFALGPETRIQSDAASRTTAERLAERLRRATGYPFPVSADAAPSATGLVVTPLRTGVFKEPVKAARPGAAGGVITVTTQDAKASLGAEGYELIVTTNSAVIRAPEPAGLFYGTVTLAQLLPPEVFARSTASGVKWSLPCVEIKDQPRFKWRGMMLDVGRHFFKIEDIKPLLDAMALHKLNTFHWHLTDDQGWRIEIKKYPKLTEVGAWRDSSPPYGNRDSDDGQRHGGFYTQAEIREVVAYAAARHITIVPEIEMPGHASAAIASYPQLGNDDIAGFAPKVMTRWGVHPYIFAPKEETLRFLEDVLTEVCDLFPSKFIHIGGDEAPKTQWQQSKSAQAVMRREGLKNEEELQSWFVRRIGKFLESKQRRLIGWDEIQEGGLPKTATMMVWRDAKWAKHALALGNNVVMATTSHTYLDYYQAPAAAELAKGKEFECIGGLLPLSKVYSYNPAFVAENPAQEKQILGTQGQLWGEYFKDRKKVEYMAFPRLSALAEVAWTPQAARNYDDFLRRLQTHYYRLDQCGLNYHRVATESKAATAKP
jgi:hexosaminidase